MKVSCPNCGRKFEVKIKDSKKTVKIGRATLTLKENKIGCPDCGHTFRV